MDKEEDGRAVPLPLQERYGPDNWLEKINGKGLNGLSNLGNTCYMNSVLQCLLHSKWLVQYMLLDLYKDHIKLNSLEMVMVYEINKLMRYMYYYSKQVFNPINFFKYVQIISERLRGGQFLGNYQQDASEFLTFVLDILHEGLSKPINIPESIVNAQNDPHFQKWISLFKNGYSKIVHETYGQYHTRITCASCHNVSYNYDPFGILHLPIPDKPLVQLTECFDLFTRRERLDDNNLYFCDKCSSHTNAMKQTEIWKAPNTLILCLKRFNDRRFKVNTHVQFPLENFVLTTLNGVVQRYSLYAIVNHFGHFEGGHYSSHIKYKNNWYELDDGNVRNCTTVLEHPSSSAYILFYEKE